LLSLLMRSLTGAWSSS